MDATRTAAGRRPSRRTTIITAVLVLLVAVGAAMSAATVAWGDQLRDEDRLLPGTTIASVPVGGQTTAEAVESVRDHLAQRLDRELVLTHGDEQWTTSARDLGGVADVEAAVAAARERTESAGFGDLARIRWANGTASFTAEVGIEVPEDGIAAFVASLARDIDTAPVAADASWDDGAVIDPDTTGWQLDREAATGLVRELLAGEDDTAALPVSELAPDLRTETAREVATAVEDAVAAASAHAVTVSLEDERRTVTPRDLGAQTNAAGVLDTAIAHAAETGEVAPEPIELTFDDAAIDGLIDDMAAGREVAGRDAEIRFEGGELTIVPERTGVAVARTQAREDLGAALAGATDEVTLELVTTSPSVTADSFGSVLLLDQSARELHLYEGAERRQTWPVAVGTNNSPTPTGTFVIGAKRFEPTWVNPAPDRWGEDMPAAIGPGPDNPLGPRALNWNTTSGRDTLIRFHGTPNEASVGSAASNGCVRMYGDDVIELYDLVDRGTTIVSVA